MLSSALYTFAAATKFNKRYSKMHSKMSDMINNPTVTFDDLKMVNENHFKNKGFYSAAQETDFRIKARNKYLPKPYYGLQDCYLLFEIPKYFKLLLEERASARLATGKIAVALGAVSIAGILAFGRLIQHMS